MYVFRLSLREIKRCAANPPSAHSLHPSPFSLEARSGTEVVTSTNVDTIVSYSTGGRSHTGHAP